MTRTALILLGKLITVFLGAVYWWIKSSFYKYDVLISALTDEIENKMTNKVNDPKGKTVKFFDYEVEIWTLFTYSILVILIYTFFRDLPVFHSAENNTLTAIYSIALAMITITAYDFYIPAVIKFLIRHLEIVIYNLQFKGIRIKL